MFNPHIAPGIFLLTLTFVFFAAKFHRAPRRAHLRWWGWVGLGTILGAELLLILRIRWVTTFFTPLAWTGYVLLLDALVARLQGESLLGHSPRQFISLVSWSAPLWLIFEAYNLRLKNWTYAGLPGNWTVRSLGYLWSFSTIWPAVFETAAFVAALGVFQESERKRAGASGAVRLAIFVCGLALVTVPVLVPESMGRFLFGAVWIGFALLLDPLNFQWGGYSFLREFEAGRTAALWNFLLAGWVCGILWEFWNYWAGAKWIYTFPIGRAWKVFEMPFAGYLGFLPFALECKTMYEFLNTLRKRFAHGRRGAEWEMARSRRAG